MSIALAMVLPGFTYARFDQCERHVQQFGPDLDLSRAALPWNGRAPRRRMTSDRPASPAMSCARNQSPRSSSRPRSRVPAIPFIALVRRKLLSSCSTMANGRPRAPRRHPNELPCPGEGDPSTCWDGWLLWPVARGSGVAWKARRRGARTGRSQTSGPKRAKRERARHADCHVRPDGVGLRLPSHGARPVEPPRSDTDAKGTPARHNVMRHGA